MNFVPRKTEGAGKAGCPMHPQPRVRSKKAHEHSHHRFTGMTRLSPRNGFNGLLRALPGDRALLPPSLAKNPANLTPASGRQDHTTSPSTSTRSRQQRRLHPPHPAPNVRDDRETPLGGDGTKSQYSCFYPAVKLNFGNSEVIVAGLSNGPRKVRPEGCAAVWRSHPGHRGSGSLCYSHHSQAWRRPS